MGRRIAEGKRVLKIIKIIRNRKITTNVKYERWYVKKNDCKIERMGRKIKIRYASKIKLIFLITLNFWLSLM